MPTRTPTSAPTWANNYDGVLTLYDGRKCPEDLPGTYIGMPVEDFNCISTYLGGAPAKISMQCVERFGYTSINLQIYDPNYPTCTDQTLDSEIINITPYQCTSSSYFYNSTSYPYSFTAACGQNLVGGDCETVFNGVLPQS